MQGKRRQTIKKEKENAKTEEREGKKEDKKERLIKENMGNPARINNERKKKNVWKKEKRKKMEQSKE